MGPMMLHDVEGNAPVFIQSHDFTVNQCVWRQGFTSAGNGWEFLREQIAPTRPQCYAVPIPTRQAAVPVELDLVEPVSAFRQGLNRLCIHRLDEVRLCRRQGI